MISLRWNFKVFELLFTYIHLSSATFSVLFKHKSLSFVNFILSCMAFQYFVGTSLYLATNFRDQPRRCTYFVAKLTFIAGIFLKKYPWCMKIHFQFDFIPIWSIWASILSIIAWKTLASGWSPSELAVFLKLILGVLGRLVNFKIPKRFLCRWLKFPDYLSVS